MSLMMHATHPLLQVKDLQTGFDGPKGFHLAVDGVSFSVNAGETLALVGESGCGKSVTSLSLMRLISQKQGRIAGGEVLFHGKDLLKYNEKEMRLLRGRKISMIFQDPMTSLNPVMTCGSQVQEMITLHQPQLSSTEVRAKTIQWFEMVGIPDPERRLKDYPHQMSGGMRQRVMIAMALCCGPELLIADEPTTALDVTIQAQILKLIQSLQKELNIAMILITHDLGVVAENCSKVAIMYAGRIIETGSVEDIFGSPKHPYTKGLLDSIPHFDSRQRLKKLATIPGRVPVLEQRGQGCHFYDRCSLAQASCKNETPPQITVTASHSVRCQFPLESKEPT